MKSPTVTSKRVSHLESVNEGYFRHMYLAAGFGIEMLGGGLICLVHALFPFLFEKTGSNIIRRLHDRMVTNRHNLSK